MRKLVFLIMVLLSLIFGVTQAVQGLPADLAQQETETPSPSPALFPVESDTPEATTPAETPSPTEIPIPADTDTPLPAITDTPIPSVLALTGVEPARISKESGGVLSIYGSGFIPGLVVRLVGFGLLDAAVLNSTAIRAIIPPGLPDGRYDLEVILPDGVVASLDRVVEIRSFLPAPTSTATPGRLVVYGQPQLLIQSARTQPENLRTGNPFTLELEIVNRGDFTATNVRVALGSLDLAVPTGGSNLVVLDLIATHQSETIALSLALNEAARTGYNNLEIVIEYSDYYGRVYTSHQSVGLNIADTHSTQPLVLLAAYHTEPDSLSPGDAFTLTLEITNVGKSEAHQLLLTFGRQDGDSLAPFAIIGSGNVKFVPNLSAGASLQVEQRFILDGAANSGVYNLPITLAYDNPGGVRLAETQVLNLLASRRPQLQIDFYQPVGVGQVGIPLQLPVEVINIGRNLVNASTLQVSAENLEVTDGSIFLGALDGGTSGSLDAMVIPERSGTLILTVSVNYLDDFNQARVFTETLEVAIEPAAAPELDSGEVSAKGDEGGGFWDRLLRFLRGLFGLGS